MAIRWNRYIATVAANEEEACEWVKMKAQLQEVELIHHEPAEEMEEQDTFVYRVWDETLDEKEEGTEWLWDHYALPELENRPIEFV